MENVIEFEEVPIVIGIPEGAVKVDVNVTVLNNDMTRTEAVKRLGPQDIRDLRKDFQKFIGDDWNALVRACTHGGGR